MSDLVRDISDPEERRRAIALFEELDRFADATCPACGRDVCGHQYVMNAAMGFKDVPRCGACLAAALDQDVPDFVARVADYIDRRACFHAAWEQADRNEGATADGRTCHAWLDGLADTGTDTSESGTTKVRAIAEGDDALPESTAVWDAGDMSCGDLVLELRMRLMKLAAGDVLELVATDAAAPEDIPAWCKLTGHRLLRAAPPTYHIRRKDS